MKKCTQCFVIQPLENFRVRIRKLNRDPYVKEEYLAACKARERFKQNERKCRYEANQNGA